MISIGRGVIKDEKEKCNDLKRENEERRNGG
jgi:hypothetical protein